MFENACFLEHCNIQPCSAINADHNSDATGDRIKLNDWLGVAVAIVKPAGTAGDDITVNFLQHTAASGGTSKALNVSRIWFNIGGTAITAPAGWVYGEITTPIDTIDLVSVGAICRASANSSVAIGDAITDIASDSNAAVIVFDIKANDLDGGGGFNWLSMDSAGAAIGNALIANSIFIPYGAKYVRRAHSSIVA